MNITDEAVKIIKAFKPIGIKTEIKHPVVNYRSPTNNFYIKSIEIDMTQLNLLIENISDRIIKQIKEGELKEITSDTKRV